MSIVVKMGSSMVASDDGGLRTKVLDSITEEVGDLEQEGQRIVLVTSGAIARGMRLLNLDRRPEAMEDLQACSAIGQGDLFRAYQRRLDRRGVLTAQILLTAADLSDRSSYLNARQTLSRLIKWGTVPVVNENDTTATDEITFGDNDFLAAQLAGLIGAELLVLLTNTDGLFTANPHKDASARLIPRVDSWEDLSPLSLEEGRSAFGTGGMASKIRAARIASESGVAVVICNGTKQGALTRAVGRDPEGTWIEPARTRTPPYKRWLRDAKAPVGSVYVDGGAEQRLMNDGTSLLAVGVRGVEGHFDAGDAVYVRGFHGGMVIGKGISNFSSEELQRIKGKRSEDIGTLIEGTPEEVIHRDRFVLL
jgi:glutamate 5-kinase